MVDDYILGDIKEVSSSITPSGDGKFQITSSMSAPKSVEAKVRELGLAYRATDANTIKIQRIRIVEVPAKLSDCGTPQEIFAEVLKNRCMIWHALNKAELAGLIYEKPDPKCKQLLSGLEGLGVDTKVFSAGEKASFDFLKQQLALAAIG